MMVGILYYLGRCLIENNAEFTQAVFAPFILYVVAGSRAGTLLRTAPNSSCVDPPIVNEWRFGRRAMALQTVRSRQNL